MWPRPNPLRAQLIDATLAMLGEHGLAGVTRRGVAKRWWSSGCLLQLVS
jgi:DNA-binding transcriptional regulator YbjK